MHLALKRVTGRPWHPGRNSAGTTAARLLTVSFATVEVAARSHLTKATNIKPAQLQKAPWIQKLVWHLISSMKITTQGAWLWSICGAVCERCAKKIKKSGIFTPVANVSFFCQHPRWNVTVINNRTGPEPRLLSCFCAEQWLPLVADYWTASPGG